ncbi:MAG: DUF4281 domain-containing protein [Agarilytica sp.]
MNNEFIFSAVSNIFVLGWLSLLIGSFLTYGSKTRYWLLLLGGRLLPLLLLGAFIAGVVDTRSMEPKGDIFTYNGIITMLSIPERILNIWTEILAYMLFVARWITDDLEKRQIAKGFSAFCVVAAFLSGAAGILAYGVSIGLHYTFSRMNFSKSPI